MILYNWSRVIIFSSFSMGGIILSKSAPVAANLPPMPAERLAVPVQGVRASIIAAPATSTAPVQISR
jgi:hypothetical protein